MAGANWKDRKAAMDEVEQLLVSAGNRIQPQVRLGNEEGRCRGARIERIWSSCWCQQATESNPRCGLGLERGDAGE